MLAAKSTERDQLSLFSLFLRHSVSGKSEYVEFVEKVIDEAIKFQKSGNPLEITSENYELVVYLVTHHSSILKKIGESTTAKSSKKLEELSVAI